MPQPQPSTRWISSPPSLLLLQQGQYSSVFFSLSFNYFIIVIITVVYGYHCSCSRPCPSSSLLLSAFACSFRAFSHFNRNSSFHKLSLFYFSFFACDRFKGTTLIALLPSAPQLSLLLPCVLYVVAPRLSNNSPFA